MERERRRLQLRTHFAEVSVTHLEFGPGGCVLDADEPVHAVEGGNTLGVRHDRHLKNTMETLQPLVTKSCVKSLSKSQNLQDDMHEYLQNLVHQSPSRRGCRCFPSGASPAASAPRWGPPPPTRRSPKIGQRIVLACSMLHILTKVHTDTE